MKAIVLVGGEGTRLRPLTYTTPKQLLPVAGVAMLQRVVAHLAKHGVDEVILSMGYKPDAFLAAYPNNVCAGVPVRYVVEAEPLDTPLLHQRHAAGCRTPYRVHVRVQRHVEVHAHEHPLAVHVEVVDAPHHRTRSVRSTRRLE